MNKVIYKYQVFNYGTNMPQSAEILHVGQQNNDIFVWALVDPNELHAYRMIRWVATGEWFDPGSVGPYLGTVHLFDGSEVWHIYDEAGR